MLAVLWGCSECHIIVRDVELSVVISWRGYSMSADSAARAGLILPNRVENRPSDRNFINNRLDIVMKGLLFANQSCTVNLFVLYGINDRLANGFVLCC